jgi:uncharacterized ubiquitin-like protein YukD
MAKVLRITDNDYRIIVGNNGTIVLDTTGAQNDGSGRVIVRGDLEVKGNTTTVDSTIVTIADNIIILSHVDDDNDTRLGLPASLDRPYSSGLQIDRGLFPPARWVYDDSITWTLGGTNGIGTWVATQGNIGSEQRLPLSTPGIVAGGNFYVSTGNGVISVTGTNDYELKIWNYDNGVITPDPVTGNFVQDDDNIPNAKSVKDLIDFSLNTVEIDKIVVDDTSVRILDKNNVISQIDSVGSLTVIRTVGTHGYDIGDTITITGVTTSPTDAIIEGLNGTWTVVDIPLDDKIQINRSTTSGDPAAYIVNSGRTVSADSRVTVGVENNLIASFYSNRIELSDLQILGNEISTYNSNDSIVLSAPGVGTIKIKDTIELTKTPGDDEGLADPTAPIEGIKVYSKTPGTGKTGLYFVNENEYQDEIISKNRALLYGMLF